MSMERRHLSTGESVVACADLIKVVVHIQGASLRGSLEHHVLKKMTHPHNGRWFIPGSGANKKSGRRCVCALIHFPNKHHSV